MKKKISGLIIGVLILIIIIDGIFLARWLIDLNKSNQANDDIQKIVETNTDDSNEGYKMTKQAFDALKAEYPNIIAYIEFSDDFISEPIVQADDNDSYLRRWIDGTYNTEGSIYFDYSCNKENQNITIYGHNVYYDSSARFSPLETLVNQDAYDLHHQFKVWYEDGVRTYEIGYVAEYDTVNNSDFDFKIKNFYTDEIYSNYVAWLNAHQQINPVDGTELTKTDNLVTLQTCVKWHDTKRHLVIGKEVAREEY